MLFPILLFVLIINLHSVFNYPISFLRSKYMGKKCNYCNHYLDSGESPYEMLWTLSNEIGPFVEGTRAKSSMLFDENILSDAEQFFLDYCESSCPEFKNSFRVGHLKDRLETIISQYPGIPKDNSVDAYIKILEELSSHYLDFDNNLNETTLDEDVAQPAVAASEGDIVEVPIEDIPGDTSEESLINQVSDSVLPISQPLVPPPSETPQDRTVAVSDEAKSLPTPVANQAPPNVEKVNVAVSSETKTKILAGKPEEVGSRPQVPISQNMPKIAHPLPGKDTAAVATPSQQPLPIVPVKEAAAPAAVSDKSKTQTGVTSIAEQTVEKTRIAAPVPHSPVKESAAAVSDAHKTETPSIVKNNVAGAADVNKNPAKDSAAAASSPVKPQSVVETPKALPVVPVKEGVAVAEESTKPVVSNTVTPIKDHSDNTTKHPSILAPKPEKGAAASTESNKSQLTPIVSQTPTTPNVPAPAASEIIKPGIKQTPVMSLPVLPVASNADKLRTPAVPEAGKTNSTSASMKSSNDTISEQKKDFAGTLDKSKPQISEIPVKLQTPLSTEFEKLSHPQGVPAPLPIKSEPIPVSPVTTEPVPISSPTQTKVPIKGVNETSNSTAAPSAGAVDEKTKSLSGDIVKQPINENKTRSLEAAKPDSKPQTSIPIQLDTPMKDNSNDTGSITKNSTSMDNKTRSTEELKSTSPPPTKDPLKQEFKLPVFTFKVEETEKVTKAPEVSTTISALKTPPSNISQPSSTIEVPNVSSQPPTKPTVLHDSSENVPEVDRSRRTLRNEEGQSQPTIVLPHIKNIVSSYDFGNQTQYADDLESLYAMYDTK